MGKVPENRMRLMVFSQFFFLLVSALLGSGQLVEGVADLFKGIAGEMTKVEFDRLKDTSTPALLNISEESRRMNDMMKLYKYGGDLPMEQTLVLNTASPLVEKLTALLDSGDSDRANVIAKQIYMLSSLSQRQLTAEELVAFLNDSYDILGKL